MVFYRLTLCCLLVVVGCKESEKPDLSKQRLQGRWELVRGLRNQRETKTLHGTYFIFSADGKMRTNLPVGPQELLPFEIVQNTIQHQTSPPTTYRVLEFTDSTLVVAFSFRGLPFELHFRRTHNDTLPPSKEPL